MGVAGAIIAVWVHPRPGIVYMPGIVYALAAGLLLVLADTDRSCDKLQPPTKSCWEGNLTVFRDPQNGCEFPVCPVIGNKMYPWSPEDKVEVFYAEFLLSHWILDHAPWNAYHSGIAVKNNRTGQRLMFDYAPDDTASVTKLLIPELNFTSQWSLLLTGQATFRWRNVAHLKFRTHWSSDWTKFVRIAITNGSVINRLSDWVFGTFVTDRDTFDSLEVVSDSKQHTLPSTMCHDFTTDAMRKMWELGVKIVPEDLVFRDHIMLYARKVEHLPNLMSTGSSRRAYMRYWRMLEIFREQIMDQFTYGRDALLVNWKLGLPMYLTTRHQDYKIWLSPPLLNYCYLPLAIPPRKHNPWGNNKLCALSMSANLTNTTVPWSAMLIGLEDKLDRPDSLLALLLTAVVTSVMGVQR